MAKYDLQPTDILADYVETDRPQEYVSRKKEFMDLKTGKYLSQKAPGAPFPHQEFVKRYVRSQTDRFFLLHDPGTGKSRSLYEVAEDARRSGKYKGVYWLVKGPNLEAEAKNQIICSGGPVPASQGGNYYITPAVERAVDETIRKTQITISINRWYTIETYDAFSKRLYKTVGVEGTKERISEAEAIEMFSDCLIFVDEVHNIANESAWKDFTKGDNSERSAILTSLAWLFNIVERTKVVLASATPMIDDAATILPILSLLLPTDLYEELSKINIDTVTFEQLQPYITGLFSYVRAADTGADIRYQGAPLRTIEFGKGIVPRTIVKQLPMKKHQRKTYAKHHSTKKGGVYAAEQEASLMTFPDGSIGIGGFNKYVKEDKRIKDKYIMNDELRDALKLENLGNYSAKFEFVVRDMKERPNLGTAFAYTSLTKIGAIMLGLAFEANGFERYMESRSIFKSSRRQLPALCQEIDETRRLRSNYMEKPRYAIITGKTTPAMRDSILETFNSYENREGKLIAILIGSKTTRDGLNLAHGTRFYNVSGSWNMSSNIQAMYRIIRSTLHRALLELIKERYNRDRVDVEVFLLVTTTTDDPITEFMNEIGTDIDEYKEELLDYSFDAFLYATAEAKDVKIRRILNMLKKAAVDYYLNTERNFLDSSFDGMPECDYAPCHYTPIDPKAKVIEEDTYDVFYADEDVKQIMREMVSAVSREGMVSVGVWDRYKESYVSRAISQLVNGDRQFYDDYGHPIYIKEKDGILYSSHNQEGQDRVSTSDPLLSYYSFHPVAIEKHSLAEIARLQTATLEKSLEEALDKTVRNVETSEDEDLVRKYLRVVFKFKYPIGLLHQYRRIQENTAKKPGKAPVGQMKLQRLSGFAQEALNDLTEACEGDDITEEGDTVLIHTLYSLQGSLRFDVISNYVNVPGRLRIYENGLWRDLDPENEAPVFAEMIKLIQNSRLAPLEEKPFYGMAFLDRIFTIRNKQGEEEVTTARGLHRGKACTSFSKQELIAFASKLDIYPPRKASSVSALNKRKILVDKLKMNVADVDTLSPTELELYYQWAQSDVKNLCQSLKDELMKRGWYFDLLNES